MTNVYISLGRLITPKETEKKLERMFTGMDLEGYQKRSPVKGFFKYIYYKILKR